MKVGNIVEANNKGQIVIPKKIRDMFGITPGMALNIVKGEKGFYIYPISEVVILDDSEDFKLAKNPNYLKILKRTRGILGDKPYYDNEDVRRKREIQATVNNKKLW